MESRFGGKPGCLLPLVSLLPPLVSLGKAQGREHLACKQSTWVTADPEPSSPPVLPRPCGLAVSAQHGLCAGLPMALPLLGVGIHGAIVLKVKMSGGPPGVDCGERAKNESMNGGMSGFLVHFVLQYDGKVTIIR